MTSVAGVADGLHQLLQHAHRAAADGDVADRNGEPLGELLGQRAGAVVRVAVDPRGRLRDAPPRRTAAARTGSRWTTA